MVRIFIALFLLALGGGSFAQEDTTKFRYQSMLKGTATISPGFLLNTVSQTNIYINGDLEYFPEDKISLRGEVFWMVGAQQKPALLTQNSSLMFGALYHFHKNRFDFFAGLETGVSLTKPCDSIEYNTKIPVTVVAARNYDYKILPLISPVAGVTFYVSDYFNFFLKVSYVTLAVRPIDN